MYDCSVPGCKAKGVHNFPRNDQFRRLWEIACRTEESKIYNPAKISKICSAHFKPDDYFKEGFYTGVKNKKRVLRKNVIPSRFPWNTTKKSVLRKMGLEGMKRDLIDTTTKAATPSLEQDKSPISAIMVPEVVNSNMNDPNSVQETGIQNMLGDYSFAPVPQNHPVRKEDFYTPTGSGLSQNDLTQLTPMSQISSTLTPMETQDSITEYQILQAMQTEVKQSKTELRITKHKNKQLISIEGFKGYNNEIFDHTGMESYEKFMAVFQTLGPAVYLLQNRRNVINAEDQFFLTLIKLRQNRTYDELANLFSVTSAVAANIFTTWVDYIYEKWKMVRLSPEKVEILVSPLDYLSQQSSDGQREGSSDDKKRKGKAKKKGKADPEPTVPDKIPEGLSNIYTILRSTETIQHVSRPKLYLICKILCCFIDNTINPIIFHNRV